MDERIPFFLALAGAVFGGISALGMGAMMLFFGTFLGMAGAPSDFPMMFMGAFFAWFFVVGVAGAICMAVGAAKLHREPRGRAGATWSIVGGGVSVLGGNMIAAALGIVAGVLALSETKA